MVWTAFFSSKFFTAIEAIRRADGIYTSVFHYICFPSLFMQEALNIADISSMQTIFQRHLSLFLRTRTHHGLVDQLWLRGRWAHFISIFCPAGPGQAVVYPFTSRVFFELMKDPAKNPFPFAMVLGSVSSMSDFYHFLSQNGMQCSAETLYNLRSL